MGGDDERGWWKEIISETMKRALGFIFVYE